MNSIAVILVAFLITGCAAPPPSVALPQGGREEPLEQSQIHSRSLVLGERVREAPERGSRIRYTINDGWRYAPGPIEGAEAPDHADSSWEDVDLPHTWNAQDAFDDEPGFRRGIGWYRKQLDVAPELQNKQIYLFFEGANQVAEVWVNGERVGEHIGGYTAFVFDITDQVHFGEPNVVAVRVNNSHDLNIPPLNADFTFYGGIYRDVWLLATEAVHVEVLNHASPGVFIDTPEISAEAATVRIRGAVVNETGSPKQVEVVNRIVDPDGSEVATLRSEIRIDARASAEFEQQSEPIANPRLWSPNEPNLYRVFTELREGGDTVDRIDNPLGFRWFRIDPADGFFLNGEPLKLVGTNRHQDLPEYGNALPDWAHRRDLRLIKDVGFNFLRLAHYPQDPTVLQEADHLGLILWEEIPVVNLITLSEAFAENAERMLTEMIRQHYNHPSVLFWGYMNEVMLREPDPLPAGYYERVVELARRLEERVEAEDPSRATVTAISFDEIDNGTGFQDISDILGLNLYFGWYYRDLDGLGAYLDSLHAGHPERPLMISEYGAGSDERVHTLEPEAFDFSVEHQQRFHQIQFPQLLERPYVLGTAIWNQFDFGSNHRQDTKPGINQKGIFFFDRTPKDIAFFYRAQLSEEPVLRIATREWAHRAGSRPEDRTQPVTVYSNLDAVELSVNGRSLGTKRVENNTAVWEVPFEAGANRLVARGTRDGEAVEDVAVVEYHDRTPLFTGPASEARIIAVNVGGHYQFVDPAGTVWEADRPYEPGRWGHVGGEAERTHHSIYTTPFDPLLQATREGMEAYRFDVIDGSYEVQLEFAEIEHDEPGQRVFSVWVNEQPVVVDLDLAARHGRWVGVDRTVSTAATEGQGITIRFDATAGQPTISGILLRRM